MEESKPVTIEEAAATITDVKVGEKRKRSGRHKVGGKGDSWTALQNFLQLDATGVKPRNGLPGVPYVIKNMVAALKTVWSLYTPDIDPAKAPAHWKWIALQHKEITAKIMGDVYTPGASKLLQALADVSSMFAKRASVTHIKDEEAPVDMFTAEVIEGYSQAAQACNPSVLALSNPLMTNFVPLENLQDIKARIAELMTNPAITADDLRMLNWGGLVMELSLPSEGVPDSIRVHPSLKTDILNTIVLDKGKALDKDVNSIAQVGDDLVLSFRRGVSTPYIRKLEGQAKTLMQWALAQRASADHLEHLYPRRLNTDRILRRLCKSALKPFTGGRVLTSNNIRSAWVSYHCRDVLASVEQHMLDKPGLEKTSPLQVLAYGVLPKHVDGLKKFTVPPVKAATAEDLVSTEK